MLLGGERGSCDVTDDLSNCFPTLCVCVCPHAHSGHCWHSLERSNIVPPGQEGRGDCVFVCVCVRWKTVCVCHIYFKRLEV